MFLVTFLEDFCFLTPYFGHVLPLESSKAMARGRLHPLQHVQCCILPCERPRAALCFGWRKLIWVRVLGDNARHVIKGLALFI